MAAGHSGALILFLTSQTMKKKRLLNKFENLGFNRTFVNGKLTLCHFDNFFCMFVHWLRSYGLAGCVKDNPMLASQICRYRVFMYEYVTNTVRSCKLLVVKS